MRSDTIQVHQELMQSGPAGPTLFIDQYEVGSSHSNLMWPEITHWS